ncbi:hypothetical protein DMENIID0001_032010 [Sergentomyia squamirostris]
MVLDDLQKKAKEEMEDVAMPNYLGRPLIADRIKDKVVTRCALDSFCISAILAEMFKPTKSFGELRKEMEDMGNGISKKTITNGYGGKMVKNSKITVNFTLILESELSDEYILNSTLLTKTPFQFVLGINNGVLPGFEKAVMLMRNQEKAHFIVPHQLLYGERGMPPKIPPRQDGFLIIEVIRVIKTTENITENMRIRMYNNFNQAMVQVEEMRDKAKAAFDANFYQIAIDFYHEAIIVLHNVLVLTEAENNHRVDILSKIYLYAGMTLNKMDQPALAVGMLIQAAELESKGAEFDKTFKGKLYLHLARSYRLVDQFSCAFMYLHKAKEQIGENGTKQEFKNLFDGYENNLTYNNIRSHFNLNTSSDDKPQIAIHTNRGIMRASYEKMIRSFIHSDEPSRTFYAIQSDHYGEEFKKMTSKYKNIKIQMQKIDKGSLRYILTKK